jgi:3-dehydroquinate dehydratase/shikimate dehydrogenase
MKNNPQASTIQTKRLILRQWEEEDLEPFAELNADPRVMEYFPSTLSREESKAVLKSSHDHIAKYGWGKWAVALIETGEFVGRIGLEEVDFQAAFSPSVELGYRLAFKQWGKGYALEGAKAALQYGFTHLKLNEIVAFTPVQNMRSRVVMARLGMHHDAKYDFDHPKLPKGHKLSRHVLYRLGLSEWQKSVVAMRISP